MFSSSSTTKAWIGGKKKTTFPNMLLVINHQLIYRETEYCSTVNTFYMDGNLMRLYRGFIYISIITAGLFIWRSHSIDTLFNCAIINIIKFIIYRRSIWKDPSKNISTPTHEKRDTTIYIHTNILAIPIVRFLGYTLTHRRCCTYTGQKKRRRRQQHINSSYI